MAEKHKQPNVSKQVYEQVVTLARSEIDSTTERFKHKLEKLDKRLELIDSKMAATESRKEMQETEVDEQAATAAAAEELAASFDSESDDIDDSDMSDDAIDARVAGTKARMERELVEKREIYTLAWIMYMRFVQRAEGIDAVRQLLRRPRADPSGYVTHHLFVAAALMEYHVAKKPGIAAKLFEFYSKMHSDQSAYIFDGHRRSTAALGDASPADIDSGSEFAGVAVASVSGRHLLKSQLLALVTPKRFVKMNTSALEEYDPIIEDFEPPEP
ncbi:mRNA 3'-end-processing protein rna14, partial [Coemansia sp. RSA 2673]